MEMADSPEPIDGESMIDLSGDGSERDFDLQAFADEVAYSVDGQDYGSEDEELSELRSRIKELEESQRSDEDKYKRLLADFQNLKNKTAREIQREAEAAKKQVLLEVLQVLDSFNRCLNSTYQDIDGFRTGIALIQRQFDDALRRQNVIEIECKAGDTFDPHFAEALTSLDTEDYPEGCVVDVCEKGYKLGDQLLRPARVVVARNGD